MRDKDRKIDHLENQIKSQKDENGLLKNELKDCKKKLEERSENVNVNSIRNSDNQGSEFYPLRSKYIFYKNF